MANPQAPAAFSAPGHVPPDLVVDFDLFSGPEFEVDPHEAFAGRLVDGPGIFYTPRNGGHWCVIRVEDALEILGDPSSFSSSRVSGDPTAPRRAPLLLPLMADPPDHTAYRKMLAPFFSPHAMQALEDKIRRTIVELIEAVRPAGRCDFVRALARQFPVDIFLGLVDIPTDRREDFAGWVDLILRTADPGAASAGHQQLFAFMSQVIAERRRRPGADLISQLLTAEAGGRRLDDDELLSLCVTIFIGGLDTVVAASSFSMNYLATHGEHRRALAANPDMVAAAADELLRRHGVAPCTRTLTKDLQYNGITFRKGEQVVVLPHLVSLDPRKFPDPLNVDFHRRAPVNYVFGAGPHRCLGSHLARLEMRLLLEEWFRRIPDFMLEPGEAPETHGGLVWSMSRLPLVWPQDRT